jgi:hypothetical protein
VSRSVVSVEGPQGDRDSTRATVALAVERWRVGIISVGEDESQVRARLAARPRPVARGIAAQILAAAAARAEQRPLRVFSPGEDPWWDERWRTPRALGDADPTREREALLIEPLAETSFSPFLARGLLYYALWTSRFTCDKTWPAFRRPSLELEVNDDLRGLHYEELVDELREIWGQRRLKLARPVAPAPLTPARKAYRGSRVVFWFAIALAVVLSRQGGRASSVALVLAGVAAVAVIASRVAASRMQFELPRRRALR